MLGRGSFAVVVSDREIAIKKMKASDSRRDCIPFTSVREVAALAALCGAPHVPRPISMEARDNGTVHIRMQRLHSTLMEEQELRGRKNRQMPIQEVRRVVVEICRVLSVAHACGISHRDIKLENIMLDSSRSLFLIDWGLSWFEPDASAPISMDDTEIGTPIYRSPELASGSPHTWRAADMWALGIVAIELFVGMHPFRTKENAVLLRQITHSMERWERAHAQPSSSSPSRHYGAIFSVARALEDLYAADKTLATAIGNMVRIDPRKRAGADDVIDLLDPARSRLRHMSASLLPPPPLPAPGTFHADDDIRRAHSWITELCVAWGFGPNVHDAAQWIFASSVWDMYEKNAKKPTKQEVARLASTCVVISGKALSIRGRLTSSAQRVCDEHGAFVRESDKEVSAEFKRIEAELLCTLRGRLFFKGAATISSLTCTSHPHIAALFAAILQSTMCSIYSHGIHAIVDSSVGLARALQRPDAPLCELQRRLASTALAELTYADASGSKSPVVLLYPSAIQPDHIARLRAICEKQCAPIVLFVEKDDAYDGPTDGAAHVD